MTSVQLGEALAALNACLNGTTALLLLLGYRAIRQHRRERHQRLMIGALATSTLFLMSYLTRISLTGIHRFSGEGILRTFYLALLTSHTILAAVTPVLAVTVLVLALRGKFPVHRRLARITLPIWLYVSLTGVMVYLMLYHMQKL